MTLGWELLLDEDREREYSPSSCIGGNYAPHIDDYASLSDSARKVHPPATFRYGSGPKQTFDLFRPERSDRLCPVVVFFHGGYWQALSKRESAFAALDCLAQHTAFVAVDYTLAPHADLDAIVSECRVALRWILRFGEAIGIDATRVIVTGSSAGAHLAAMVAAGSDAVRGALLVSGIYEIEPLIGTSINNVLHLDTVSSRRNSPLHLDLAGFPPTVLCWGEIETDQAKRQSRAFGAALSAAGVSCNLFEVAGRNHFDVVLELADPATAMGRHLHALVRATERV